MAVTKTLGTRWVNNLFILSPQETPPRNGKGAKQFKSQKVFPQQGGKAQWQGNQVSMNSASTFQAQTTVKRLDDLESKVAKLETQQTQLSDKVDTRFDQVSAQLQQVLNAVAPANQVKGRGSDGQTGMTPPPKQQKAA